MKASRTGLSDGRKVIRGLIVGSLVAGALLTGTAFGQTPRFSLAGGPPLPSESKAMALSVIGTAAAVASAFTGEPYAFLTCLAVGPSMGFFYGGCWGRGLLTATLRLAGTFAAVAVALNDENGPAAASIWLGAMIGTSLLDIATVKSTVRRHNAKVAARRGLNVDVAPFALPKGGGLQVRLAF